MCEYNKEITNKTLLITGAAGYIGSHFSVSALKKGYNVILLDNLDTGHIETIHTLKNIKCAGKIKEFFKIDLKDEYALNKIFETNKIDCVIHFASYSQVQESVLLPEKYYRNNVDGSKNLLNSMLNHEVKKIIFSSTASVYGEPKYLPIDENHPLRPINPYGETKLAIENLIREYDKKYNIKSVIFRYFNVIGADFKNHIGEWHNPETHLLPNILNSIIDGNTIFNLYGNDYETKDGTCVRDYIDVEDIINAHIKAINFLETQKHSEIFNLGAKKGISVTELINICEKITNKKFEIKIKKRRDGDCSILIADNKKVEKYLNWYPQNDIKYSVEMAYNWHKYLKNSIKAKQI